jgi:exopolyphosphatase/guanosine-5'-triphosphate,3'-diphosphate pyrophosphatase
MKAIIDIGSNSVLLLLADRAPDGSLRIVEDRATITRLSEGVASTGVLSPVAIERTLACLRDYVARAREHVAPPTALRAVATEGVRMAANRGDFLGPAAEILGAPVEILSGEDEARLSYLSVAREEPAGEGERPPALRVIDIGGASTELVTGRGEAIEDAVSLPIGGVRMTEAFVRGDPPTRDSLAALEAGIREVFARHPLTPLPVLHGLAGTVTTAAGLMLGLDHYARDRVDRTHFSIDEVRALQRALARETLAQRAARPLLGPGRADVCVAGLTIMVLALEHAGAHTLIVRDRGLRYALV